MGTFPSKQSIRFRTWSWQTGVVLMAWHCLVGTAAFGQEIGHNDVDFGYADGRLVLLNGPLFTSTFPLRGISQQFTSSPGFTSETDADGGIGPHEEVVYHVLEHLSFWDGTSFAMPRQDVQIRIAHDAATPDTIVRGTSGVQKGSFDPPRNRIGQANAAGEFHGHVDFILEPEVTDQPDQRPELGAYGLRLQLETSSDAPLASAPFSVVFNYGLDSEQFEAAKRQFELRWTMPLGDFDGDRDLDVADLDALTTATWMADPDPQFDLNQDALVNQQDRKMWIEELKQTYIGDSNLDGQFNTQDLVQVLQHGEYEDASPGNSLWADGDWNGDLDFDTSDLVDALQAGGYERGLRTAIAAVPEPATFSWGILGLVVLGRICRRTQAKAGSLGGL